MQKIDVQVYIFLCVDGACGKKFKQEQHKRTVSLCVPLADGAYRYSVT